MTRDRLDDAIDQVSARLTQVERDDELAARIVARLPQRAGLLGWLLAGWAPRLAMAVLAAVAIAVVVRPFDTRSTDFLRAEHPTVPIVELRASVEPEPNRTLPLEPLEPLEPVEPSAVPAATDHAFALAPVAAVAALEVGSLLPASLPEDSPLTLAPLAIADLPLSADFPPR